jgi:hypothetical protein
MTRDAAVRSPRSVEQHAVRHTTVLAPHQGWGWSPGIDRALAFVSQDGRRSAWGDVLALSLSTASHLSAHGATTTWTAIAWQYAAEPARRIGTGPRSPVG